MLLGFRVVVRTTLSAIFFSTDEPVLIWAQQSAHLCQILEAGCWLFMACSKCAIRMRHCLFLHSYFNLTLTCIYFMFPLRAYFDLFTSLLESKICF